MLGALPRTVNDFRNKKRVRTAPGSVGDLRCREHQQQPTFGKRGISREEQRRERSFSIFASTCDAPKSYQKPSEPKRNWREQVWILKKSVIGMSFRLRW